MTAFDALESIGEGESKYKQKIELGYYVMVLTALESISGSLGYIIMLTMGTYVSVWF